MLFHVIISLCFTRSVKTFVNKVNDWLIKTNGFLIGEFIFVLNTDWRRNKWMLITSLISIKVNIKKFKKISYCSSVSIIICQL